MFLDLNRWNLAIFHGMLSESLDVQLIANTCCCVKSLQAKLTSGGIMSVKEKLDPFIPPHARCWMTTDKKAFTAVLTWYFLIIYRCVMEVIILLISKRLLCHPICRLPLSA